MKPHIIVMDLEIECSAVGFSGDNESPQHTIHHVDANKIKVNQVDACKIKDNGLCANDDQTRRLSADQSVGPDDFRADNHVNGPAGIVPPMHSSSPSAKSTTKGHGLKKWRRIKRDFVKEPTAVVDGSKTLKRGYSGSENPTPRHMASTEIKQNSEPHLRPVNISKNANVASGFMIHSPCSDSTENSEDRSSKSSTASGMPKVLPTILGYVHRRNHMKNFGGMTGGNSSPRVQQGSNSSPRVQQGSNSSPRVQLGSNSSPRVQQVKDSIETSKKLRGEMVKIEKENSLSSIGSDSRSSNIGFMSSPFSVASNLKQSGNSLNLDWKIDDEAHEGEDQINEEVQNAYRKEISGEIEELPLDDSGADLSREAKAQESESHRLSPNQDRLVNSILSLQSVQEALESELHKFEEIGKEPTSSDDGSVNLESIHADSTFADRLNSEKISCTSGSLETQLFTLTHKVTYLESKLEEARALVRARESKVSKLETSVNSSRSSKEEPGGTTELQQDKYRETEFELEEDLFLQRMETEIELLALTRAIQKLRVNVSNRQTTVFKERTSLAGEQARMLNNLGEKKYGKYYRDAIGTNKVSKTHRRVLKATLCIFTQLVLLVLVFLFVVLQLTPFSGVDVPT
ncbi:hypothetical protein V6N12_002452 [Hibiscus sabdariffa]|uniref:Uncharacterized protein n=1 Tax=Hibiscus sabdariffa TaxID=183260 RepID=A0ABR2B4C7_9ROSI